MFLFLNMMGLFFFYTSNKVSSLFNKIEYLRTSRSSKILERETWVWRGHYKVNKMEITMLFLLSFLPSIHSSHPSMAPLPTSFVTMDKSFNLACLSFILCKMEINIISTSMN